MTEPRFIAANLPNTSTSLHLGVEVECIVIEAFKLLAPLLRNDGEMLAIDDQFFSRLANADEHRRKLRHPLSLRAAERADTLAGKSERAKKFEFIAERTRREKAVLDSRREAISSAIDSEQCDTFIACLESVVSDLLGQPTALRTEPTIILPDAKGVGWHCLDHSEILPRLDELHAFIRATRKVSPLVTAIVALVMLSGIHPFMDGNGRTSRIIFHAILQRAIQENASTIASPPGGYIPLRAFYFLSDFGFEIRLRQTFRTSDWQPITRYFCNLIGVYAMAQPPRDYRAASGE
jgi:Fic/DOC family